MFFKQCRMVRRKDGNPESCVAVYTCWIPEQYAKVGKVLSLFTGDGRWIDGWEVAEVYTRLSEEYVREHSQDYKTQHLASDKLTPNKGLGIK